MPFLAAKFARKIELSKAAYFGWLPIIHTAALFRCSTGKQQILGYGSFSCINVSKNS